MAQSVSIHPDLADLDDYISTTLAQTGANIKASTGGIITLIDVYNGHTAVNYLQVYGVPIASVVFGTTIPIGSFAVPASSARTIEFLRPLRGISALSVVFASTRNGNGAPTVNGSVQIKYK